MKVWVFIFLVLCGFLPFTSKIDAQGRGGYDQFGEYVDEAPIDEKGNKNRLQNQLQEKLRKYQEKLKEGPQTAMLYFMMGNLLAEMRRPSEAVKSFKEAIELNPLHGETHYNLAKAYDALRDGTNAINYLRKAEKIFHDNLYVHWQTKTKQLLKQIQKQYGIQ